MVLLKGHQIAGELRHLKAENECLTAILKGHQIAGELRPQVLH